MVSYSPLHAVLLQVWAHPILCNHKVTRGAAHPDYPLGGDAARLSTDVLEGQRQQCVTCQDGNVFSIHLLMQWSLEWPTQGRLRPVLQLLMWRVEVHLTGLQLRDPQTMSCVLRDDTL